jgi:hypothetical protein
VPALLPAARRLLATLLLLAAVPATAAPVAAASGPRWTYRVRVADDLASLDVRLAFEGFVPRRLVMADGGPPRPVEVLSDDGVRVTPDPTDPALLLAAPGASAHVAYRVDLRDVNRGAVQRVGGAVLAHACSWMLRPALVPPDLETIVAFEGPPGLDVEAPWERLGDPPVFRVPRTSWDFIGHVAFGRLETQRFEAAGAQVRLVRLGGPVAAGDDGLRRWVAEAVAADAEPYGGRFPERRFTVFVVSVPGAGEAVPFGSAWYGGGPHVVLLVGAEATEQALRADWTAVHEIFHATMPPIDRDDSWLSEGFATWHQEILRARAGMQTPAAAWQEVESGFRRGRRRGGDLPLEQESRAMHANHSYHRVYWAGAALALLLDVDLRRASGGARTLDDVLRWMREIPGGLGRPVTAREAIAYVDARLGEPRFGRLAATWLARSEFPDVAPVQAWLGVAVGEDGNVVLKDGAPGARVREAITARPAPSEGALR